MSRGWRAFAEQRVGVRQGCVEAWWIPLHDFFPATSLFFQTDSNDLSCHNPILSDSRPSLLPRFS